MRHSGRGSFGRGCRAGSQGCAIGSRGRAGQYRGSFGKLLGEIKPLKELTPAKINRFRILAVGLIQGFNGRSVGVGNVGVGIHWEFSFSKAV